MLGCASEAFVVDFGYLFDLVLGAGFGGFLFGVWVLGVDWLVGCGLVNIVGGLI